MNEKKQAALAAIRDPHLTDDEALSLAFHLTPLQRPDTALGTRVQPGEDHSAHILAPMLKAEALGLMRLTREPCEWLDGRKWVHVAWCATEAGRIYAERYRPVWDDLGVRVAEGPPGYSFSLVPMPWPGLPKPYQPGTVAETDLPVGRATPAG